jgi:dihydroorotate dehydrogenase
MDLSVELCGLRLEHPVLNGSGTFDAIAARRVFGAASWRVSLLGLRLEDDHPRASGGNPPPRIFETRRDGQLDQPAEQGGWKDFSSRTCRGSPSSQYRWSSR